MRSSILAVVLVQLLGIYESSRSTTSLEYEKFRLVHRKDAEQGSVSFAERQALFEARSAEVAAHNAQDKSWTMIVNKFADFTDGERRAMLGYKRVGGRWSRSPGEASLLQTDSSEIGEIDISSLAKTVDWTTKMNFSNFVHNQGACGSCWAHAAVGALEAHAELSTGLQTKLATQEIIDCTANPRHCGGTGGCHGATAELAFEQARQRGIAQLDSYTGVSGKCPQSAPSALKVKSFVRLPENKESYLLHALANSGPVVMSVDAENLFMYNSGVFSGCQPDTVVNHAVLGVGYGKDKKSQKDYWLIKNSWGEGWGEKGYLRVQRFNDDNAYCGTDTKPQEGVYCDEHPASIRVCGMCGATSDSVYPVIPPKTALRQQRQDMLAKVTKVRAFDELKKVFRVF